MNIKYNFAEQVAIVTGSAGGIGKAIAEKLHEGGATVVISDIQHEKAEKIAQAFGERAICIPCDIRSPGQVRNLIQTTVTSFDRLDIMVNNAGINATDLKDRVTVDKYPDDIWHKMIDVDLNGTFYCCKSAAEVMVAQRSGTIINVASVAGVVALRLQIGFVAAKAAIIKMTEAMACELGPYGIRVNTVSPGSTITDVTHTLFYGKAATRDRLAERMLSFIPEGRAGETIEVANAVAFLASNEASYINGHNLVVDGGWTSGFNRDF